MDTKDIPTHGPSDWRREPSERRNAFLGKLAHKLAQSRLHGRKFQKTLRALAPEVYHFEARYKPRLVIK
jgi:hypothetical protein